MPTNDDRWSDAARENKVKLADELPLNAVPDREKTADLSHVTQETGAASPDSTAPRQEGAPKAGQ